VVGETGKDHVMTSSLEPTTPLSALDQSAINAPLADAPLIDVHSHFVTENYAAAAKAAGHVHPDGMPGWPAWSVDAQLAMMDRHHIQRAIMSMSSPGVHFGDDRAARDLAREVNDFGAKLVVEHPDRFGLFASLPLPDVEGAVAEAVYALDELGVDGVTVETNAHGRYLGDPSFAPLLEELDDRSAVIFVHPTSPACTPQLLPEQPRPMVEFLFESTRNIADVFLGGTIERYPNLKIIVPHSGGVLALVADRLEAFRGLILGGSADRPSVRELLGRLWYDMAGTPFPLALPTLSAVVGTDHLLYGSDYPWTPDIGIDAQVRSVDTAAAPEGYRSWRELTTANAGRLGWS
jgi:predicted TIM-barrel fold metal-dependent hydrolase